MKETKRSLCLPSSSLVLISIISAQTGSALAKGLFDSIQPLEIVFLQLSFASILSFLTWRPSLSPKIKQHFGTILLFSLSLILLDFFSYQAIARIPLGIVIALQFSGPLGLAMLKSRQWVESLWVLLASTGLVLLTPISNQDLDWLGIGFALLAGLSWAAYILMSARMGQHFSGPEGVIWAMAVGVVLLTPFGLTGINKVMFNPGLLTILLGIALLSSVIPYYLEFVTLRNISISIFGVLLNLEPMIAAMIGFVLLGETLTPKSTIAILLISIAAAGATRYSKSSRVKPIPTPVQKMKVY